MPQATVARLESDRGRPDPRLSTFGRLVAAAGCRLAVLDAQGRPVPPLSESLTALRDNARRRLPAHLDPLLAPTGCERLWWQVERDYTFMRTRWRRDIYRERTRRAFTRYLDEREAREATAEEATAQEATAQATATARSTTTRNATARSTITGNTTTRNVTTRNATTHDTTTHDTTTHDATAAPPPRRPPGTVSPRPR